MKSLGEIISKMSSIPWQKDAREMCVGYTYSLFPKIMDRESYKEGIEEYGSFMKSLINAGYDIADKDNEIWIKERRRHL